MILPGSKEFEIFERSTVLILEDDVWVVDYKSNRPPPTTAAHVPESYRAQLAAYKSVLEGLYPGKPIRTFLLWTETPRLMEVPVGNDDLPPSAKSTGGN